MASSFSWSLISRPMSLHLLTSLVIEWTPHDENHFGDGTSLWHLHSFFYYLCSCESRRQGKRDKTIRKCWYDLDVHPSHHLHHRLDGSHKLFIVYIRASQSSHISDRFMFSIWVYLTGHVWLSPRGLIASVGSHLPSEWYITQSATHFETMQMRVWVCCLLLNWICPQHDKLIVLAINSSIVSREWRE